MANPMKSREMIQALDKLGYNPNTDILVKLREGRTAEFTMPEKFKDCNVFQLLRYLNNGNNFEINGASIDVPKVHMIAVLKPKL